MSNRVNIKITGEELKGIKRLRERLKEMAKYKGKIGVFGGNYPETGEPIAEVAYQHEFGVSQEHQFMYKGTPITIKSIPTRSFLRLPIQKKVKKIIGDKEFLKALIITSAVDNKLDKPLKVMCANFYALIQEAFDTAGWGSWMRNKSRKYIKLKGSDQPLIDTGLLRASITYQVEKEGE